MQSASRTSSNVGSAWRVFPHFDTLFIIATTVNIIILVGLMAALIGVLVTNRLCDPVDDEPSSPTNATGCTLRFSKFILDYIFDLLLAGRYL